METNQRFSILPFPQFFNGATLRLRIIVLPRNQNPLKPAIEQHAHIPNAPAFANVSLTFDAKMITGLSRFPNNRSADDTQGLDTDNPTQQQALFLALAKNFNIENLDQLNINLDGNFDTAKKILKPTLNVKKYLPFTYREQFNFTTPRTRNAVTDDSYHCAVRDAGKVAGFKRSPEKISWGKVFAYALRQPQLARALGMLYETSVEIDAAHFPNGGWLYVDLGGDSDYRAQQDADDTFIKKYAARIPPLKPDEPRTVFAPILFPVLYKPNAAAPDPEPVDKYDQIFLEAAAYQDGMAKIVHAYQPSSRNLLAEKSDGAHPTQDVGVRLGWDDEQILIWYMRQMIAAPIPTDADHRVDAPLGVFGYAIDVRDAANQVNAWESLNQVESKFALTIPKNKPPNGDAISIGNFVGELPYQVYPAQLDGNENKSYWLPMYFANWNGHSMVLPDQTAAAIYQTTNPDVQADPETPTTGTGVSGAAKNQLNDTYAAAPLNTKLRYGKKYQFRVRMQDLSGGGPEFTPTFDPLYEPPSAYSKCDFKRYVAPNQVRMANIPFNTDEADAPDELNLRRPILGYPAVVYTGKYADPIGRLQDASDDMLVLDPPNKPKEQTKAHEAFGIADPDVDRVEITVEVQTLRMDNLLSVSGKENYVHLYTTTRRFPAVNNDDDYEATLTLPIVYRDCHVLHVGKEVDLINDLQLADDINKLDEIVLPTGRTVRLTLRARCEEKASDENYYGLLSKINPVSKKTDPEMDVRFGHILQTSVYQPSANETNLFVDNGLDAPLEAIYLQPEPLPVFDGKGFSFWLGKEQVEKAPDMIQRLAKELNIENIGLTLNAPKGERIIFGCSNRIRHTPSPENSSLTFASKNDLMNHWLCCVNLTLNRDWTWDAMQDRSFVLTRTKHFTEHPEESESVEVGAFELRHTASFEMLHTPQRDFTRLIFIDAVEPKDPKMQPAPNQNEPRFPDTIQVEYNLHARFKPLHAGQQDELAPLDITLPITTPPAQIPRIASAGLAFSPYLRNDEYSQTEPRQRYLWIEFQEPIRDPKDTYFARVLAYAADQLISNNAPEQFLAPEEPALPIDPEYIRVLARNATNDLAGSNALQPMQKANDSDTHYLLPLPPGLHADAAELFGFFTYELRVGHYAYPKANEADEPEMVWCTAQGRFGRPLRATGIQHPAPTLTCAVDRDEEKVYVSAPYATAVCNGKNVTCDPPRTQLWCLLYAQVKQADNLDFRNILLDDKPLDWRVQIETDKEVDWIARYDDNQLRVLKQVQYKQAKISKSKTLPAYKLVDFAAQNKDATKYGTTVWTNDEVEQLLKLYGLPTDLPLSVLVVEFLPTITKLVEHFPSLLKEQAFVGASSNFAGASNRNTFQDAPSPLSDRLGHHRILRTSPLTEVPEIC